MFGNSRSGPRFPVRGLGLGAVAVVALLARLVPVLTGGGLVSWGRYDDGVYYAAAASLADGRVPYREFVLLHPPMIAIVLVPFALLGRLTTDPVGFATARIVWMLLGCVTAVLTARLAGRWGAWPGLVAGLLYATSVAAAYGDQTTLLEPVADLAVLGALLLLTREEQTRRTWVLAGVLLGLAAATKIWYAAPVLAVLVHELVRRGWRPALTLAASAAATATVVLAPFLALAPRPMWHDVLVDQLGRRVTQHGSLAERLGYALGGRGLGLPSTAAHALTAVLVVVTLVALVVCLGHRASRLVAVVLVVDLAVLLLSPSFFKHYGHLTAAPLAVVLAVGWTLLVRRLAESRGHGSRLRAIAGAVVVAAVLAAGAASVVAAIPEHSFPAADVRSVLPAHGCITTDDPIVLVAADRLSSDLTAGCPVAVDVTGQSYGNAVRRRHNPAFQRWLAAYLRSGDAIILTLPERAKMGQRGMAALGQTVLLEDGVRVILPVRQGAEPPS